jgi:GT2 family glycosyltransferase/glycosyltransferase involved in cell wall biosynthesis
MRILEIVHGFPPAATGGTELYARAHALALRDAGDEVVVLAREADASRADYDVRREKRDGLDLFRVNNTFRSIRSFEETYRNDAIGTVAAQVIDEVAPDVAHVHHLTGLSTTIIGLLAERNIPCVFTLHDYWLLCHRGQLLDAAYQLCDGPGTEGCGACLGSAGGIGAVGFAGAGVVRGLERRLPAATGRQVRRAAEWGAALIASTEEVQHQERRRIDHMREVCGQVRHFLAPSRFIRDRFVAFGMDPARVTVAPNGVDHVPFVGFRRQSSVTTGSRALRLGFLGNQMISKAPHLLLEAAAGLPVGSVSVDLFGACSDYHGDAGYRQQLEPLLGGDGVRVHGPIPHDAVAAALASIDVLVVPSIWPENAPLVIQEAFIAGIPVVASRIGGIPEMVTDGTNGLLFTAGDAADLSRTLARLIDEPGLVDRLRDGIPAVRSIEEDVGFARGLYQTLRPLRAQSTQSRNVAAVCASSTVDAKRLAAVVLNFRTPDETLLAVKSLLASRRALDFLIVVNNDPGDGTRAALMPVLSKITYIDTSANLGFSGGMNVGIREARARGADRILLVNSDVIVPPDAIERLEQALHAGPQVGIVGPVVLARSEPDRIATLGMSYAPVTGRMKHRGTGNSVADHRLRADSDVVDAVSGCLMLIKGEVFDAVGLLDEQYFFTFEDLDFCLKARRAGFSTVLAGQAVVYHEGGQSLGARSPKRFYYAARNHLRLARETDPAASPLRALTRACWIVMLNLAHAIVSPGGSLPVRVAAVARGTRDYVAGRFGPG